MLASASPLKPKVVAAPVESSSKFVILLVECFVKQNFASAADIPQPSSTTRISSFPPS
ncbi:MAG: hypothetical protein ACD_82C00185G0002 [uncultured bacterium]|nr:MAG: hypothetical protein ACD_82C00185G0002 [uncultured bacterium]